MKFCGGYYFFIIVCIIKDTENIAACGLFQMQMFFKNEKHFNIGVQF